MERFHWGLSSNGYNSNIASASNIKIEIESDDEPNTSTNSIATIDLSDNNSEESNGTPTENTSIEKNGANNFDDHVTEIISSSENGDQLQNISGASHEVSNEMVDDFDDSQSTLSNDHNSAN